MRIMFSLDEIAHCTDGQVIIPSQQNKPVGTIFISGVSKDTRTINEGELYVALKGENFDGHDFCQMAFDKGASVLLVSDPTKIPDNSVAIIVKDTLVALGQIARHYRFKNNMKTICVTGSVGKTSTREMIALGLSSSRKVYSTKANENNDVGLPMTILSAPENTEVLVLEMGMRLRGEIAYLTKIACPDIAIITNVGFSHIERLGSQEEILKAKMEIVEGINDGGVLAVNGDDELLFNYSSEHVPLSVFLATASTKQPNERPVKSNSPLRIYAEDIVADDNGMSFSIHTIMGPSEKIEKNIHIDSFGIHHVRNSMFAYLCAVVLEVPFENVTSCLSTHKTMRGRGAVITTDNYTIIDDAYNASPESMQAAFANLNIVGEGHRKIACLGGMLEMGEYAPLLHEKTGAECGTYDFDVVLVTGDNKESFVKGFLSKNSKTKLINCENSDDVESKLKAIAQKGDCILFKASNAFGFQKIAERMAAIN